MTDEEAMEALLNSDGYSFPTWTLKRMFYKYESTLDNDLIFWSNATADLRHNGEIGEDDLPDELLHALNELWTDGHLVSCYLVELKGRYGIALESIYDRDFAESLGITYLLDIQPCTYSAFRIEVHTITNCLADVD